MGRVARAGAWEDTAAERALRETPLAAPPTPVHAMDVHLNVVLRLDLVDGSSAIYKPQSGEAAGLRRSVAPGTYVYREVAAHRIDQLLGFNRVPVTVLRSLDAGLGAVQAWIANERYFITDYVRVHRAQVAVIDYLLGNTDRNLTNWRTDVEGQLAAVDNGLCLPVDLSEPLRSKFVATHLDQELPPAVVDAVRQLDRDDAMTVLRELGIESRAISGFEARLQELQSHGRIVAAAWPRERILPG